MTNILLVSEDYIKSNSNLSDNLFGKFLLPAIREAQDIDLQAVLGTNLYQAILDKVKDGTIEQSASKAYKSLIDDYIQPMLLYRVLDNILPIIGVKLSNLGTMSTNDEKSANISESERDRLRTYYGYRSDFYTKRLTDFLKCNNDFPEIHKPEKQMHPHLSDNVDCPIWLGGKRGR